MHQAMALEFRCPGCGRSLRIPEEHAGKQVRCPACQQVTAAPASGGPFLNPTAADAASAVTSWHLRTPEGQTYGPVSWRQVEAWAREGRVSADCELAATSEGPWRAASELLPGLQQPATRPLSPPASPAPAPWGASPVPARQAGSPAVPAQYLAPHRGGIILVLGLLGFVMSCPVFSLIAWVMGSNDLAEMRAGRMDPSGESLTQAGRIMGMLMSLFYLAMIGLALTIGLFAALAGR